MIMTKINSTNGNNNNNNKDNKRPLHFEQLDVEIIDNELQLLLLSQKTSKLLIQKFLVPCLLHYRLNSNNNSNINSSSNDNSNNEKEIISLISSTILKSIIYFITIGYNDIPTPAMSILGLKYDYGNTNDKYTNHHERGLLSKLQKKILLYLFSVVLPCIEQYIRNNEHLSPSSTTSSSLETSSSNNNNNNDSYQRSSNSNDNNSSMNIVGYNRRKSIIRFLFMLLDLGRVINYIRFLIGNNDNKNIPPLLCLQLLGITYCKDNNSVRNSSNDNRIINYLYAYRRMLYSELFRCFVLIFPKNGFILVFK